MYKEQKETGLIHDHTACMPSRKQIVQATGGIHSRFTCIKTCCPTGNSIFVRDVQPRHKEKNVLVSVRFLSRLEAFEQYSHLSNLQLWFVVRCGFVIRSGPRPVFRLSACSFSGAGLRGMFLIRWAAAVFCCGRRATARVERPRGRKIGFRGPGPEKMLQQPYRLMMFYTLPQLSTSEPINRLTSTSISQSTS